jgi:DNA polymerase-3 subunit delta
MAKAAASIPALGYLAHPSKHPARPVCAVFGDEPFLKLQVLAELRRQVLAGGDSEFSYRGFIGEEIEDIREVFDELGTVALFGGGQRLVVVNDADPFVSDNRPALEDYVAAPKPTGVLVLEVKTWQSNTKLYKAVAEKGLSIECKSPKPDEIARWMRTRAETEHGAKLEPAAAERLLEIVGSAMGRLDQEIAKLALLAGPMPDALTPHHSPLTTHQDRSITKDLVDANVGGWQVRQIWDMVNAAAAGDARAALVMLDRLVAAGEEPIALLAMLASKLRPLAAATRVYEDAERAGRRITPRQAVAESSAKVWPAMLDEAERNMRQLGRERTGQIYRWLLDADLALKGGKSKGHGSRMVLEELIVRLGKPITA